GSPVVPGAGLIPSNRGSQSRPGPRHPAGVAPGKRPRLTPNPALAIKGRDQFLPFGTPGGDVQTQAMLQVLLNRFVFGQDVQSAIEAPRFATYSFPSSFAPFDYYPGRLAVEGRIPEAVTAELARRGHEIQRWPDWIWTAGAVCAILADRRRGVLEAGADPRRAAYAIADSRDALTRLAPPSYFCTCWKVSPSAFASVSWFMPSSRRRIRIRPPTCTSIGLGMPVPRPYFGAGFGSSNWVDDLFTGPFLFRATRRKVATGSLGAQGPIANRHAMQATVGPELRVG